MFSFLDNDNEDGDNRKPIWLRSIVPKTNRKRYTLNPHMKDQIKKANRTLLHRLEYDRKREDFKSNLLSNMIVRCKEKEKQIEEKDISVQTITNIKPENIFFFLLGGLGMFFLQKYKSNF